MRGEALVNLPRTPPLAAVFRLRRVRVVRNIRVERSDRNRGAKRGQHEAPDPEATADPTLGIPPSVDPPAHGERGDGHAHATGLQVGRHGQGTR